MNYYDNNISDSDDEENIVCMEEENVDKLSSICLIHFIIKILYDSDYISTINEYLFHIVSLIIILYYLSVYIYMNIIEMKKTIIIMYVTMRCIAHFINLYDLTHKC